MGPPAFVPIAQSVPSPVASGPTYRLPSGKCDRIFKPRRPLLSQISWAKPPPATRRNYFNAYPKPWYLLFDAARACPADRRDRSRFRSVRTSRLSYLFQPGNRRINKQQQLL